MNRSASQQGYSLLELVIYIALFVFISIVITNSLLVITKTYASAAAYRRLQNNGELVMERITREARNATSITTGSYGAHPSSITFSGIDTSGTAHTISFAVASGAVQITDNGAASNLTTSEVTTTSFVLRSITTPAGSALKVELTLTTANGHIVSAPFYSTIMLRGE